MATTAPGEGVAAGWPGEQCVEPYSCAAEGCLTRVELISSPCPVPAPLAIRCRVAHPGLIPVAKEVRGSVLTLDLMHYARASLLHGRRQTEAVLGVVSQAAGTPLPVHPAVYLWQPFSQLLLRSQAHAPPNMLLATLAPRLHPAGV